MLAILQRPDTQVVPEIYCFLFNSSSKSTSIIEGKLVHAHMIKTETNPNTCVETKLVIMYAKRGCLKDARLVLNRMQTHNVFSWTAMIGRSAKNRGCEEAVGVFRQMQKVGIKPCAFSIASVLPACANLGALDYGKELHAYAIQNGFESDVFVGSCLVDLYAKCGNLEDARNVFDKMCHRNVVSWNALIAGYAHGGQGSEALQLFRQMQLDGIAGDLFSWNTAIMCCAQNGRGDEAMKLFCQMQLAGVRPNPATIVSVLPACANSVALEQGREIHAHVFGNGFESDLYAASALVDMYAKCGCVEEARQVFDDMPQRNAISWSAMIAGYAKNGYAEDALALFHQMKEVGIVPNHVTFTGVLSACGHAGLLDEGLQYFDNITKDYQLVPSLEHYACIVDLLGRSGCLDKARDFIITMPLKPDAYIWGILLGACRIHCNVELGEFAAKHLSELDPENTGNCVLLSNIYAAAGRCVM